MNDDILIGVKVYGNWSEGIWEDKEIFGKKGKT